MSGTKTQVEAKNLSEVNVIESPECFLASFFWLTMGIMGLWLYIHEPADLPILSTAVAAGIYLLSNVLVMKKAFSESRNWGLATIAFPVMTYVYAARKFSELKCEITINVTSLAITLISSYFLLH